MSENVIIGDVDVKSLSSAWIGVDLDGTLARYDKWRGADHVGEPIWGIVQKIKEKLKSGRRIKIFTARVCDPTRNHLVIPPIRNFLGLCGLPRDLEITNVKDFNCIEFWDDRAKQVVPNEGLFLEDLHNESRRIS